MMVMVTLTTQNNMEIFKHFVSQQHMILNARVSNIPSIYLRLVLLQLKFYI